MARTPITQINTTDTFNTWFNTTKNLITEVNWLNSTGITGITGGNGIGITTDGDRNYSIRFNGQVAGAVTFSGPVTFQDTLTASSINVTSTRIYFTPKVSGLTSGNVVRIDSANGLTLAKANSADNAEVLGIVVSEDASSNIIAIAGQIDNTLMSKTIANALGVVGGTLGKGSAYFLSPSVAGGITTIEPITYGQVSKPILLGITGDQGVILPYRGIIIEGISAGITSELDNKMVIEVDFTALSGFTNGSNYEGGTEIKIGDPVFYTTNGYADFNIADPNTQTPLDYIQDKKDNTGYDEIFRYKLAGVNSQQDVGYMIVDWAFSTVNNANDETNGDATKENSYWEIGSPAFEEGRVLGLVSQIITTPSTTPGKYILEITLPGGVIKNVDLTNLDSFFYSDSAGSGITKSNAYYIEPFNNDTSAPTYGFYKRLFLSSELGNVATERYPFLHLLTTGPTTADIIFDYKTTRQFKSSAYIEPSLTALFTGVAVGGGSTGGIGGANYLPNGSFAIWQRPFSGLTAGNITTYLTPVADRWFWTNWGVTGLTLSLTRSEFDSNQTTVPGSPLYYVNVNTQHATPIADPVYTPRLENIQKNSRLLQGQTATFSFYGKSTASGSTLALTFSRYESGDPVNDAHFESYLENRSVIVSGITLGTSWKKYSQTFVVPTMGLTLAANQDGWIGFGFEFPTSSATLSIAQATLEPGYGSSTFISNSVEQELQQCSEYYQRSYDLDETPGSTNSRGNEYTLALGNMNGQIVYPVKFPVKMAKSPDVVTVYSPVTGTATEAYNVNAGQDLRYTTGTLIGYPWDATPTYRQGAGLTGNTSIPNTSQHGFDIQINSGAVSFDTLKFHWIADADIIYRG